MIYVDTSVVLAHLLTEDRSPPASFWQGNLVSSRLLEYEVWTRLHSVVSRAVEKLKEPNGIFRDSLIENISDLCGLLPRLNVTDCPDLERARIEIEKIAGSISPEVCRENSAERAAAADSLSEITEKMSVFMGQAPTKFVSVETVQNEIETRKTLNTVAV